MRRSRSMTLVRVIAACLTASVVSTPVRWACSSRQKDVRGSPRIARCMCSASKPKFLRARCMSVARFARFARERATAGWVPFDEDGDLRELKLGDAAEVADVPANEVKLPLRLCALTQG